MKGFYGINLQASALTVAACWTLLSTMTVDAFSPSHWNGMTTPRSSFLVMKEQPQGKSGGGFSLSNLFGGNKEESAGGVTSTLRGSNSKLEPHPSVRKHISPLNRLGPDPQVEPQADPLPIHPDVRSGTLPNGLPYIILPNKSPPGRFEAHLQVFSGSGTFINWKASTSVVGMITWTRDGSQFSFPLCFGSR
jgi:hypothetical protein